MTDREKYQATLAAQRRERELATMKPYPYRITAALDMNELYGPEVDRALGGEEPMVDLWETGELVPTVEQIKLLAEMTGVTPEFFYRLPMPGAPGFICGDDGCERVWVGPPPEPEPLAEVIAWPGRVVEPELTEPFQDALW